MKGAGARLVVAAMLVGGTACAVAGAVVALEPQPDAAAAGLPPFALDDFGGVSRATLETNALPYKIVATALVLREERDRQRQIGREDIPRLYRQFGFLYPSQIGNWPGSAVRPHFERPLGTVGRVLAGPTPLVRIDAVNLGCATCHGGPVYGADGRVTDVAWIGLPNTSINLEAYAQAVYQGLKLAVADQGAFRGRVRALFPEISARERLTMRYFVLPKVAKRLRQFAAAGDAPTPYSNGGPGRTNGVATLKYMIGAPQGIASGHADVGFTSIPDLSSRGLRSSLLYDGIYAPSAASRFEPMDASRVTASHIDSLAQIIAFFTVSTMGVTPDVGERAIPAIRPVMTWIATGYTSPPFPGPVDVRAVREGADVFANRCARCHGTYDEATPRRLVTFPNRLVPQGDMGTDSARWAMIDTALIRRLDATAYGRHMSSARTGGYVAPILSGLWATAPYLHNGSIPTLWQLLTPDERPVQFLVGGHALDFTGMGIAGKTDADGVYRYDSSYVPWSVPELYDTRLPGLSNRGHDRQVAGLTPDQKRALIAYLKTL